MKASVCDSTGLEASGCSHVPTEQWCLCVCVRETEIHRENVCISVYVLVVAGEVGVLCVCEEH